MRLAGREGGGVTDARKLLYKLYFASHEPSGFGEPVSRAWVDEGRGFGVGSEGLARGIAQGEGAE